jgi:hypothetical protein
VSPEEADTIEHYKFSHIFYQRVKNHCKIFSCFVFVKTFIFVSHGRYLSLFNVLKQRWLDHIEFESDIVQVFRSEDGKGGFDICVLQQSNIITILARTNKVYPDKTPGKYEIETSLRVEGEFLQHD